MDVRNIAQLPASTALAMEFAVTELTPRVPVSHMLAMDTAEIPVIAVASAKMGATLFFTLIPT